MLDTLAARWSATLPIRPEHHRTSVGVATADTPKRSSWRSQIAGYLLLFGLLALWPAAGWLDVPMPTDCRTYLPPLLFGVETDATMQAKSGMLCPLSLRPAIASIGTLELVSPPANGVAITNGRSEIIYRSYPSFRGEDAFAVATHSRSPAYVGTSAIRVHVLVK